ncbi:hypothetical protein A2U01_0028772, partial [Trifolium medium]|nr:hypothetical protein [Trifolium medium]
MSSSPAMSSPAAASSTSAVISTSASSAKSDFHLALAVTNIKNSIPFVLEMEKDHYNMWAELFEVHARAQKVMTTSFLNLEMRSLLPLMLVLKCGQFLTQRFFNGFIPP